MYEILIYSILYLVLFGLTDLLYHKFKVKVDYTRKIVHICTGLIALTFPIYLKEVWQVAILCGSFLGLMALSERYAWFKSITAIKRKSHGSWLFAVVVLLCFFIGTGAERTLYYLPLLLLTIADPMAALVGKKFNYKPIIIWGQTKTIGGSLAFFITALVIIYAYANYVPRVLSSCLLSNATLLQMCIIASVATVAEFFSTKGWDNLTIPLSIVGMVLLYTSL